MLPKNKINLKNEIRLKLLSGFRFFPNSKNLPCDKQHYFNQTSSFWGENTHSHHRMVILDSSSELTEL